MRLHFSKKHAFTFILVFLVEVYIALFVTDQIIRPLVGDVLVVVLIYSFVRMILDVRNPHRLAVCILLFSYLVELGQYFDLASILGLADSKFATTVIGTSFDWRDLLAYTVGFILILVGGRVLPKRKPRLSNHSHAADAG
jgi:hypothetical protein